MNTDAESHAKEAYRWVIQYLEKFLDPLRLQSILQQFYLRFPSWDHIWTFLRSWLQEQPLTDVRESVHGFARLFPDYGSFANELEDSLIVHEPFWNQVHEYLCRAKGQLIC